MNKTHPRLPWVPKRSLALRLLANLWPGPEILPCQPLSRAQLFLPPPSCCRVVLRLNIWPAWSLSSLFTLLTLGFSSPHPPNSTGSFLQQEHPDSPAGCHLASLPNALRGICAGRGRPSESQSHLMTHAHCKVRLALVVRTVWPLTPPRPRASPRVFGGGWRMEMRPRRRQGQVREAEIR